MTGVQTCALPILYYPSKGVLLKLKGYGPVEVDRAQGVPARYALTILAGTVRERIDHGPI